MFLTQSLEELKTSLSHDTDMLREQQNIKHYMNTMMYFMKIEKHYANATILVYSY